MKAYTYVKAGQFALLDKPRPVIIDQRDAIVRVTMGSICTSDLHIKHGSVPRAIPGITVGHEMVGVVEQTGANVRKVRPGDHVTVNVETFCGECFFCRHGYVNNCTDHDGGWALGCRIDGGQAERVRVPYADNGLNLIPPGVSDEQALLVGDVLATGYWAARISEIGHDDTVLIIGAGPTGLCTLLCVRLWQPRNIIVCELSEERRQFVREHYPDVQVTSPGECLRFVHDNSRHGGADRVIEVAGTDDSFRMAWQCARPNAIVTVVALYDNAQVLPLPEMYGKNLTFKTGGVDGCETATPSSASSHRAGSTLHRSSHTDSASATSTKHTASSRGISTASSRWPSHLEPPAHIEGESLASHMIGCFVHGKYAAGIHKKWDATPRAPQDKIKCYEASLRPLPTRGSEVETQCHGSRLDFYVF